jgi:hypothetical protein
MAYLSETSKTNLKAFLNELKNNLSKSIDRKKKKGKAAAFSASIIGFTFRASDIDYDLNKEHISEDFRGKNLGKLFSKYLKKDLPLVLRSYTELSLANLLALINDPEAKKGIYYYINNNTKEVWYLSIAKKGKPALDQEKSFRTNIITPLVARTQNRRNRSTLYKIWLSDIELGHTFGFKGTSVAAEAFQQTREGSYAEALAKGSFKLKGSDAKVLSKASRKVTKVVNESILKTFKTEVFINAEQRFQSKLNDNKILAKLAIEYRVQVVAPEEGSGNKGSGSTFKSQINRYIKDHIEPALESLESEVTAETLVKQLRMSPSIEDRIADNIIDIFKDKKSKSYKKSKKEKTILTTTEKSDIKIPIIAWGGSAILPEEDLDLNSKIPYLNTRLHDKIQQNMGKGNAKQILNYRTGRFARSAEIERFWPSKEKGAVNAAVRYMRYPYGTFEPGGRLHKPGRDPHVIFRRSIRQLLQEEKIATLRRVKVELSG